MSYSITLDKEKNYLLFAFAFLLSIVTYGFTLTNFTISIDNEIPIYSDYGLDLGRWGTNLIRFHLFEGHLRYFSLVLSLFLFSISSVRLTNLFRFEGILGYLFCLFFLTFPQVSYQVVFGMMADVASFGVFLSVVSVEIFVKHISDKNFTKKIFFLALTALILMFTLSIYQAMIFVPVTIYVVYFFLNTFEKDFALKEELKKTTVFVAILVSAVLLYFLSVKIICPPVQEGGYLSSFTSGSSENQFSNFLKLWKSHLLGEFYYGEKLFVLASISSFLLVLKFSFERKFFLYRFLILFFLILSPFFISFIITSGYHPPRIYITTNLVFAFLLVFTIKIFNFHNKKITIILTVLISFINLYCITKLFYSNHMIYNHDKRVAEKIDNIIQNKYPSFYTSEKYVYFYGYFPFEYHQKFRLENSEIFGGSIFNWDNGNNYRLVNFFKEASIADYKMLETKEMLNTVKDSVQKMPAWPDSESVKMINNIMVVKLGHEKGMPLPFE